MRCQAEYLKKMNKILAAKLKLSEQQNVLIKNLPETLTNDFEGLQTKAARGKKYDAAVLFATTQAELNKHITGILTALQRTPYSGLATLKKAGQSKPTSLATPAGIHSQKQATFPFP